MKDDYQPFVLGSRFCILPPDLKPPPGEHINLTMERGAFGSGEHETTRSCLEALEGFSFRGNEKILDLGSGTGILSIAALLLGAGQAWCVDIEADAVKSCEQNCILNNVNDKVMHVCGTLDTLLEKDFDLILANIYGDILVDVAAELTNRAKPGTRLLLSGILWEYNFNVRQKYEKLGCKVLRNRMLEEFSTVLLKKS